MGIRELSKEQYQKNISVETSECRMPQIVRELQQFQLKTGALSNLENGIAYMQEDCPTGTWHINTHSNYSKKQCDRVYVDVHKNTQQKKGAGTVHVNYHMDKYKNECKPAHIDSHTNTCRGEKTSTKPKNIGNKLLTIKM